MQCLKCGKEFDNFYECPLCSEVWRKSGRFTRIFTKTEDVLLNLFLALMVLMVLAQILMRNFFQSGILGGDDLIRTWSYGLRFSGPPSPRGPILMSKLMSSRTWQGKKSEKPWM